MVSVLSKNELIERFVLDNELTFRVTDFEIEEPNTGLYSALIDLVLDSTTNKSAVIKNPKPYVILLNFKSLLSL
jgi:hypothetical protein